ncbi:MAG: hypothetical protein IJS14_13750 [Lentisphaeria bacterium]|nr:hypothetical protein [Lentisphaeria bacterium]
MFNNNEPPVSLFSFQDIITSLTGIMIFFLLLFSLSIMEFAQNRQDSSPVYKELEQIRAKNQILKNQITEMSADIRDYRKKIKAARSKDETALTIERYRLEQKLRELKVQKNEKEKKLKEEKDNYSQLEKENARLKQRKKELEQQEDKVKELAYAVEQKKKQVAEIRKAIEKRRKEVQVTVDASIKKIPVLIECSEDRICIVDTAEKTRRVLPRKSPILTELVGQAISALRHFPPEKYYFVFMVKPSAVRYLTILLSRLQSEIRSADFGIEPILENEEIYNE